MIVRMAKVELLGPKGLHLDTLGELRVCGVLQLDAGAPCDPCVQGALHPLLPDAESVARRLYFERTRCAICELESLLPAGPVRQAYLAPEAVLDAVSSLLPGHLERCRAWQGARERLLQQGADNERQAGLLETLARLSAARTPGSGLVEVVGVTLREPALAERLRAGAERLSGGRCELATAVAPDGSTVGVIATEARLAAQLSEILAVEGVAQINLPAELAGRPLAEQVAALHERCAAIRRQAEQVAEEQTRFAQRWLPLYRRVAVWLDDRLALLAASAELFATELSFVIRGWMPADQVEGLRSRLEARFGGQVLLQEVDCSDEDLARIPVQLYNPPYLRPFELLARLLPLPRYTSFDPTPFLGLCFPLFFGLMLGDIGYGLLLVFLALALLSWKNRGAELRDGAKILLACAVSTILFGFLFGECFGEAGARLLGLSPLLFARSEAIVPLLWFALAAGVVHIGLGLVLGALAAWRGRQRREAGLRLVSLLILVALAVCVLACLVPLPVPVLPVALLTLAVTVPLLLVTGGLLGPLEMLKTIGHVVSYVRLMAIGLTSVLLAGVANSLGGRSGSIVAGILVAGLLHAFNLLLGVFAPTVHALRLHYVEFFSKFFESGGSGYRPLMRPPQERR